MSHDVEKSEQASDASMSGEKTLDVEKELDMDSKEMNGGDVEKQSQNQQPETTEEPKDPNLVEFDGPDDPGNPRNWTQKRRWIITAVSGLMTFVVTFSSSIFAVAIQPVAKEYDIDTVTSTLGVALFLLGFVFGPVFFGPASEAYGRRIPLFSGYIVFAIFQIPVAVAQNVETIMLGRFISGFAAGAPLAVIGGILVDMFDPVQRAYAVCVFSSGTFCGPVAGPIVGGFVTETIGWRWTAWITLIMAGVFGVVGLFVIPETSASRILQLRARRLRYETKNWALHSKADENRINLHTIVYVYLLRPWKMIVQEPILALLTAYMSYIYGVIYLLFQAFPYSFAQERGWSLGVSSLPFVSFIFGIIMGTGVMAYSTATNFKRAYILHGAPVPEERLPPMILGAVVLPIALFWWAWTSFPSITWVPQVISTAFIGMGMLVTFWQGMNYIMDVYGPLSNSAIAINTFVRSIAGAVFPIFAPAMYHKLGVRWATSLLAFLCLAFLPAPILFYKYGKRIRAKSKYVPTG